MFAAGAAPQALATPTQLTAGDTAKVSTLSAKILAVVTAMPVSSSTGAFEGAVGDAVKGYDQGVIVAALNQAAATPGLPAAAVSALKALEVAYSNMPKNLNGNGPGSQLGELPGENAPGFAAGGGGGTASSYTQ
jgi:hypothetical protein